MSKEVVVIRVATPIKGFQINFTLQEGATFDVEVLGEYIQVKGGMLIVHGRSSGRIVRQDKNQWKYDLTYWDRTTEDHFSPGMEYPYLTNRVTPSSPYVYEKFKEFGGFELLGAVMKIMEIIDRGAW